MKSKFFWYETYFTPVIAFLISFGLGGVLIFLGLFTPQKTLVFKYLFPCFSLLFFYYGFMVVRHFMLHIQQIKLTIEGIELKGLFHQKKVLWSEVEDMQLTGSGVEKFLFVCIPGEAMHVQFKNGESEIVFIKYYRNMDRIRSALHIIIWRLKNNQEIDAQCFLPIKRSIPHIENVKKLECFGNNFLLSFNGIIVLFGWVIIVFMLISSKGPTSLIGQLAFALIFLGIFHGIYGYQLHYFRLNREYLLVRNHVWPWLNDAYLIKDIREVVIEEPHQLSTSLRIITNNYESKRYPAGSLRTKSWNRLIQRFEEFGIEVRNEKD